MNNEQGGVRLLSNLFEVSDTAPLHNFGVNPADEITRPTAVK